MWRILIFVAMVIAATFGIVWLSEQPGQVALTLHDVEIQVSLAVAFGGLLIMAGITIIVFLTARAFLRSPRIYARMAREKRIKKGYNALSQGLIAIGAGHAREAKTQTELAEKYLPHEPLVLLLKAQTAQITGQVEQTQRTFERMLDHDQTRLLGLRGLYVEAQRQGREPEALLIAQKAIQTDASSRWANDAVFKHTCFDKDWSKALSQFDQRVRLKMVEPSKIKSQRAALLTAFALSITDTAPQTSLNETLEALKLAPELVPAASLAARFLKQDGQLKKAAKILEKTWSLTPHPDIAELYVSLKNDLADNRLRRARHLESLNPGSHEGALSIAKAALQNRNSAQVREALEPFLDTPTRQTCLIMAESFSQDNNEGQVREWLMRATHAAPDKSWMADGIILEAWTPIGPTSGELAICTWSTPPLLWSSRISFDAPKPEQIPDQQLSKPQEVVFAARPPDDPGL